MDKNILIFLVIFVIGISIFSLENANKQSSYDDDINVQSIFVTKDLQSVYTQNSIEACEVNRPIKDSSQCVTNCIKVTSTIVDCLNGYKLDSSDIGTYAWFEAPVDRTCSISDTKSASYDGQSYSYKAIRECMEGQSNQDKCSNRGIGECIDSNSYKKCDITSDGYLDYIESECPSGKVCANVGGSYLCQTTTCLTGQTLCSDGICRNDCEIITCPSGKNKCSDGICKVDCGTTQNPSEDTCEQFYQDPENSCKTYSWVIWAGIAIALIFVLMIFKRGK